MAECVIFCYEFEKSQCKLGGMDESKVGLSIDFKDSAGVCSFYCVNEYPPFTASEEKDYVVPEADAAGEEEGEQQEEEEGERQARGG